MMNNAIDVKHLRVERGGNLVIPQLDVTIPSGSVTGLLGPSGCGKTTLIRCIAGIQITVRGNVTVLGEPAGSPANRARVAYVTQSSSVYPDLTVRQNLDYFAALCGSSDADVDRALEQVGLSDRGGSLTGELSGGQRTRVSLAAALLADPDVYLLDEPTVGLDPVLRRDLWLLFNELAGRGRTLLVSSHVMDEAGRCDRVLLMRDGELIADASPDELRSAAGTHDLEQAFLVLAERRAA
jgi:ABC-2 type transport system ATP-binding protein